MTSDTSLLGLSGLLDWNKSPFQIELLYSKSLEMLQKSDIQEVERMLPALVAHRPGDAGVLHLQAAVALAGHRPGEGRDASEALRLNPEHTGAPAGAGQCLAGCRCV